MDGMDGFFINDIMLRYFRSFPGPCAMSPEKRHRTSSAVSPDPKSPRTPTGDKTSKSQLPKTSSGMAAAGGDGNHEDDGVPELVPEESTYRPARISARRRRLYNSEDEPTQSMSKIVDSQEVEKFALPPASRTSERNPTTSSARRSVRVPGVDSKIETPRNGPSEGTAKSTRRTRSSRSVDAGKDVGISVQVETRSTTTPSRISQRRKAVLSPQILKVFGENADEKANRRHQTEKEYDLGYAQRVRQCFVVLNSLKSKELENPLEEVLVAETVPDGEDVQKAETEANEVEETPTQEAVPGSSEPPPKRRALRPRRTKSSDSSKTELPDPYARDTIEVDPPTASRTRSSSKKSVSSDQSLHIVEFSEEINPELVEPRVLRSRPQPAGHKVRASRVRSLSNLIEREQSVPKRSRLIRKSTSSISASIRTGCENDQADGNKGEDPNCSINESVASSESSVGVNRIAKARVMFTGIENPPREEVLKLGLKLTDIISQCTVLVAAKFTRTVKMMYAAAKGIPVVSSSWVIESAKAKKVLGIENFLLRDESAEKKFNFSLRNTLQLASETKFFKGWSFYVTKSCSPNAEQLSEILSGCDAKVLVRIPAKFAEDTAIVTCPADRKLLPRKLPVPAISVEFVFHGILKHEADFHTFEVE